MPGGDQHPAGSAQRKRTGEGAHLDIAISVGLFMFAYWAHAKGVVASEEIRDGGDRLTGGRHATACMSLPTGDG